MTSEPTDYILKTTFEIKQELDRQGIPYRQHDSKPVLLSKLGVCDPVKAERKLFVSANELLSESIRIDYLIKNFIELGTTGMIFGPSGDGKTFVAVDGGLSVASGYHWNGLECRQGLVLYFAGEGRRGLKRRVAAWKTQHPTADLSRFNVSSSTIIFDAPSIRQVVEEVKALQETTGERVALIVIDTLNRHLVGDENSTNDMSGFIREVDDLRVKFPGSVALIVHHSGHAVETSGRARGAYCLHAAMDFEYRIKSGTITCTKSKDSEPPEPVKFKLVPAQIGTDDDGQPITSCIVHYGEQAAKHRSESMTSDERILLGIIKAAPVTVDTLRLSFYEKRRELDPEARQGTLKTAFSRSLDRLQTRTDITKNGNILQAAHGTTSAQSGTSAGGHKTAHPAHTSIRGVPCAVPCADDLPRVFLEDEIYHVEVKP